MKKHIAKKRPFIWNLRNYFFYIFLLCFSGWSWNIRGYPVKTRTPSGVRPHWALVRYLDLVSWMGEWSLKKRLEWGTWCETMANHVVLGGLSLRHTWCLKFWEEKNRTLPSFIIHPASFEGFPNPPWPNETFAPWVPGTHFITTFRVKKKEQNHNDPKAYWCVQGTSIWALYLIFWQWNAKAISLMRFHCHSLSNSFAMLNLQVPCSHGALVWRSALIVTSIRSVHGIFANISKLESHVNVYIVQKRSKGIQNESKWIKMDQNGTSNLCTVARKWHPILMALRWGWIEWVKECHWAIEQHRIWNIADRAGKLANRWPTG